MAPQSWLSVLIPTYNGEDFLPATLNSIVAQNTEGVECLAIDDGSTDKTRQILNSYKEKLSIRILQPERHRNWVTNTNYGLSFATGEYIWTYAKASAGDIIE